MEHNDSRDWTWNLMGSKTYLQFWRIHDMALEKLLHLTLDLSILLYKRKELNSDP